MMHLKKLEVPGSLEVRWDGGWEARKSFWRQGLLGLFCGLVYMRDGAEKLVEAGPWRPLLLVHRSGFNPLGLRESMDGC